MSCDVLGLFAHPDDESLLAGGTLAACAAAGRRVGILSLTGGELGGAPAHVRAAELSRAAAVLGAAWAQCLEFPDGELHTVDPSQAAHAVRQAVREPQAVVTFSAEGLYWHPDHVAVHEIAHCAFDRERIYELSWPEGLLADVVEELQRRGAPTDVWGLDPHAFGAPPQEIAHTLDVSSFLDVKLQALRCHRTQLAAGHALADLPTDLASQLLGREWLVRRPPNGPLEAILP